MTDNNSSPLPAASPEPPRRRRYGWIVALAVAAGLTGAAATTAFSHGPGFGPGFGPGHWHGRMMGGGWGGPFDPARVEERADRMVRHASIELDATAEQQEKLRVVVKSAVKDLVPMREKAQAARVKARELLVQPTLDRADIERFRSEQLVLADAFSKRVSQAIGEAAEILTPEQRRKLAERMPAEGPGWKRW